VNEPVHNGHFDCLTLCRIFTPVYRFCVD